jgi:hypothetical protein
MLFPKNVCLNIINSVLQNADAVLILSVQAMMQKTYKSVFFPLKIRKVEITSNGNVLQFQ